MMKYLPPQKSQGQVKSRKMPNVIKALVMVACTVFGLRQVLLLVVEYRAFPTEMVHGSYYINELRSPAITICPRPSMKTDSPSSKIFKNGSVSVFDIVKLFPSNQINPLPLFQTSTMNGETIKSSSNGDEIWKERTFFDQKNGGYYKCFTYLRRWEQLPGPSDCQQRFLLDFDAITDSNNLSQMEVFVHDRREDFTNLGLLKPEQFVVVRNTITKLLIRPEIIQKQSRMENPCTMDESYSQTRCLEKCFWERIQTNPSLPCLFPSLMPKEVNLTKPECQTASAEIEQSQTLRKSMGAVMDQLWNCNCPERCSVTDYHIFSDPTSACQTSGIENGKALLFYRFPSSRVPYSLEMGKLTLPDLVWNVGGIVSIYLGLSLIMLSDIIEQGCFNFPCRAFRRGNEIHGEND